MSEASVSFSQVDWGNESSITGFIDQLLESREIENFDIDRQAEINIAWYRGHQLLRWNKATSQMQLQPNPYRRVRLMVNLMRGLIDGFLAKLVLDHIRLSCEPSSDDIADHDRAELQTGLLHYYDDWLDISGLVADTDQWAALTGEAYVKVTWDPQAGSEFGEFTPEEFDMTQGEFEAEFGKELSNLRTGDLSLSSIPLFNLSWGPFGAEFDDAEYMVEVYERSIASVMERYGLKQEDLVPDTDGSIKFWRPGQTNVYGSAHHSSADDTVLVKELWVKPNQAIKGLEKGRHCISISKDLVTNGSLPYRHQRIPIVRFPFLTIPGENRGNTFVTDLLPPQSDVNRTISQFAENRELMANPVWLARHGSIMDENEWTNRPGGIRFHSGEMPKLEQGAAMPNAVLIMLQHMLKFMQDIVGLRDVSQGKNPPGVRSGSGLALLKEADDERMGRIARRRREFWSDIGWLMLETLSQFVTEERVVRISGEESGSETITYMGDMLRGDTPKLDASRFNVRVESFGQPRSYSAKLEALGKAMESGAINPAANPRDRRLVLRMLEIGHEREPLDIKQKARSIQHWRNREMTKGNTNDPDIREDIQTMLEELASFRHEPFFANLDDDTKELFNRYEDQCIGLMALKKPRIQQVVEQALEKAGIGAPEPAPAGNPQGNALTTSTPS